MAKDPPEPENLLSLLKKIAGPDRMREFDLHFAALYGENGKSFVETVEIGDGDENDFRREYRYLKGMLLKIAIVGGDIIILDNGVSKYRLKGVPTETYLVDGEKNSHTLKYRGYKLEV